MLGLMNMASHVQFILITLLHGMWWISLYNGSSTYPAYNAYRKIRCIIHIIMLHRCSSYNRSFDIINVEINCTEVPIWACCFSVWTPEWIQRSKSGLFNCLHLKQYCLASREYKTYRNLRTFSAESMGIMKNASEKLSVVKGEAGESVHQVESSVTEKHLHFDIYQCL